MKPDQMIPALEELATRLGVTVRYEALSQSGVGGAGGLCKVRGDWWLLVDKKTNPSERAAALVDALSGFDTASAGASDKLEEILALRRAAKAQVGAGAVVTGPT